MADAAAPAGTAMGAAACRAVRGALLAAGALSLFFAAGAHAGCPPFLDHDLRKLHSSETVNLCTKAEGTVLLLVNTASHCGFTSQFAGLETLYRTYQARGFEIVGFTSDDFHQAADSEEEAASICYVNYGVTFTMLAPTRVTGSRANPVFQELTRRTTAPRWNFNKYLVGRDGSVLGHFGSTVAPDSPRLITAIEAAL